VSIALGIDCGTSGTRAIALTAAGERCAEVRIEHALSAPPEVWREVLFAVLAELPGIVRAKLTRIAIDGTSATVLLCDEAGIPVAEPLLYNDGRAAAALEAVRALAPARSPVLSATSSLAKLLWWQQQSEVGRARYLLHHADWLGACLHGQLGRSDYHNALKLGYDPGELRYPAWLQPLAIAPLLPQVVAPGTPVAPVTEAIAARFGIPRTCQVCAGTTDSIAAFLASDAARPGDAVTSLGSTLVLKLLSDRRIDAAEFGIYSHRLGNLWLAGGASNTGGAVLRHFFDDAELAALSDRIDPARSTALEYYPLLEPGERFPVNDPNLPPQLDPRPEEPAAFLHGLLDGMARIEARGYQRLRDLGAPPLQRVYTAGGGAKNATWQAIRARYLGVEVAIAANTDAAYGTARLAAGVLGLSKLPDAGFQQPSSHS